jgi:serine/threonine-protein phosphatase Stp1
MDFSLVRIESASATHEGRVRDHNEDSFSSRESDGFWAVADGMGGHEGGEWASAALTERLDALELPDDFEAARAKVADTVREANAAIVAEGRKRGRSMGTTLVAMLLRGGRYAVFWVGDSRAYRLRDGQLEQLSRDHSQVQEMVDRGMLTAEQAADHPMGHVLSRAVGVDDEVEVDQAEGEVTPGDTFLLCSDGLHGYVDESDIARLLARGAPDRAVEEMVERTLAAGAPDNVTVVAICTSEPTLLNL